MAYNRNGYNKRAKIIHEITELHYEPENQRKSRKAIWRKYIKPLFGMSYDTFLKYLKVDITDVPSSNIVVLKKGEQKDILP